MTYGTRIWAPGEREALLQKTASAAVALAEEHTARLEHMRPAVAKIQEMAGAPALELADVHRTDEHIVRWWRTQRTLTPPLDALDREIQQTRENALKVTMETDERHQSDLWDYMFQRTFTVESRLKPVCQSWVQAMVSARCGADIAEEVRQMVRAL